MQSVDYFGRLAINGDGRKYNSKKGLQLIIKYSVNESGKIAA